LQNDRKESISKLKTTLEKIDALSSKGKKSKLNDDTVEMLENFSFECNKELAKLRH